VPVSVLIIAWLSYCVVFEAAGAAVSVWIVVCFFYFAFEAVGTRVSVLIIACLFYFVVFGAAGKKTSSTPCWSRLEPILGHFGGLLWDLGPSWAPLEPILGHFGGLLWRLGPSWAPLDPS